MQLWSPLKDQAITSVLMVSFNSEWLDILDYNWHYLSNAAADDDEGGGRGDGANKDNVLDSNSYFILASIINFSVLSKFCE